MTEARFVTKAIAYLNRHYPGYWRKITASAYSRGGIPDIIGCYRGQFVAVECKNPNGRGRLSPIQTVELETIKQYNGFSRTAKSLVEIDELMCEVWQSNRLTQDLLGLYYDKGDSSATQKEKEAATVAYQKVYANTPRGGIGA